MKGGPDTKSWKAASASLDPERFDRELRRRAPKRLNRLGLRFVALAAKAISAKQYAKNSPVTIAFKDASTPLVGGGRGGDLFAALTYKVDTGRMEVWFGVNRNARSADGKALEPIAMYLHEGATIDVQKHPKVRQFVFARLRAIAAGKEPGDAAMARAILDGNGSHSTWHGQTSLWVIPARPFIRGPLESDQFRQFADEEFVGLLTDVIDSMRKEAA